ncbi:MAG: hypothetical protein JXR84_05585 [Anaerolineae bacterium]|nr:hypothetical protein [Anaerolineae bacterium]
MEGKDTCPVGEADAFPFLAPVAVVAPAVASMGMPISGPALQLVKKNVVQAVKLSFGNRKLVVIAPALNDRVENADEGGLCRASMLANQVTQAVAVALDSSGRRFNERLEAGPIAESAGVIFPYRVLTDVKTEKVEAEVAIARCKGVADAGFVRVEFQAQGCQLRCRHLT